MPDRISQADDSREQDKKSSVIPTGASSSRPEMPKGYINPFSYPKTDEEHIAGDGYPYVFSDIDWELLHNENYFRGMEKVVYKPTESKSEVLIMYKYTRWKTWKYLEELRKTNVVMSKEETESEYARGTVSINGVTYYILKGYEVEAPIDIKDVILTSQKQTGAAGRKSLLESLSMQLDPQTGLPKDRTRLER